MGIFTPIELPWKGTVYTIPPFRVMGMISRIEETITFKELDRYTSRGTAPVAKLCIAYAAALQYAGAPVSETEIYEHAFSSSDAEAAIAAAVLGLMELMLPPAIRARMAAALATPDQAAPPVTEDREPANPPVRARRSSRTRSRRRWYRANG